ncbi:trigger factor [[Mycoplasma] falconis]|uniref:Trigger factor n=1 Tax=[Mycoplasma] falconis TaxID=92403 RepID=A0A501XAI0_9BACT|nr:trigger factor [[Mycoplasma] falconis]TPE57542.1 trigger factor [[Mycoplasma] falconis]
MSKVIDKENSLLKVSYTLEGEEWQKAIEKAQQSEMKNVQVKGFRKGHVPAKEAIKHVDMVKVFDKAINASVDAVFEKHIKDQVKDEEVISKGSLEVLDVSPKSVTLEFSWAIFPEVTLPDYKKLGLKLGSFEVTAQDLEASQESVLKDYAVMMESELPVKKGDQVTFDFAGFVDGEAFEGGDAENFDLKVGSGQFIPGFEDQMVGMNKEEEKEIKVTFPSDYHAKHLAGKDATFKIKIHSIKSASTPELNEQFVKEMHLPLINTVEEYKQYLEVIALKSKLVEVENKFIEEALNKIIEGTKVNVPATLIKEESDKYYQNFLNTLKQQQISEKEYLEFSKSSKEDILKIYEQNAIQNLKRIFVLGQIAKENNFKLTEAQYEEEVNKIADMYSLTNEAVKNFVRFETVEQKYINEQIHNSLMEWNDKADYEKFAAKKAEVKAYEDKQQAEIIAEAKRKREAAEKLREAEAAKTAEETK